MSIQDEIKNHLGRRLFHLPTMVRSEPLIREMFVSNEIVGVVSPPFASNQTGERHAQLRAYLDAFTSGEEISISERPFNKRADTFMARVHPVKYSVWDIRAIEPRPGIRCFGCFGDIDLFIALTWDYRENLDETEDGFALEAKRCRECWSTLFVCNPYEGEIDDLISWNFVVS